MADPKEGYNSGYDRVVSGTINSDGNFVAGSESSGFKPSSYTGKVTTDAVGVTFAIATGATRLLLQSLESTGLEEFAVLAFGTSASDAVTNLAVASSVGTQGVIIRSGDSTAGGNANDLLVGIPANATHAAVVNGLSGAAQVVMVVQGS